MTFGKDISKRMSTADIFFNPAGKRREGQKFKNPAAGFLTVIPNIRNYIYWITHIQQGMPCGYTLLDEVRPSEGHVLRGALWVYLAGH